MGASSSTYRPAAGFISGGLLGFLLVACSYDTSSFDSPIQGHQPVAPPAAPPPPPSVVASLAIVHQPADITAGGSVALEIAALDSQGRLVASDTETIVIDLGYTWAGRRTVAQQLHGGLAIFPAIYLTFASSYWFTATAGQLLVTSRYFQVLPAPPASLSVRYPFVNGVVRAGAPIPTFAATCLDRYGNEVWTDTTGTDSIQVSLGNAAGATLSGVTTGPVHYGVAYFAGLHIDKPGTGYVLVVTGMGLPPDSSQAFTINP